MFSIRRDTFATCRVLIVGDAMLDRYFVGTIDRISPEAPVPVLRLGNTRFAPGGSANVAANVAALGARATLLAAVNDDVAGRHLKEELHSQRVEVVAIREQGRPTTCKTRLMAGAHQVLRLDDEQTHPVDDETEKELLSAFDRLIHDHDVVVISDYAKGLLTDGILRSVIEKSRAAGVPVIVDPKRKNWRAYAGATVITPNRQEIELASGLPAQDDEHAEQAARLMIKRFGSAVLLTRSEQGMSLFEAGRPTRHLPTVAREVFDVSGAGDTVVATFAASVGAGIAPDEAMVLANLAAGIVVAKVGTALVTADELSEALEPRSATPSPSPIAFAPVTIGQAVEVREKWRSEGLKVGFTNGCFDLVHPGHIKILQASATLCDRLIVAINSDQSVSRLKGPTRPIQSELARAQVLLEMRSVDAVLVFEEDTPLNVISALIPDVLVKGSDYAIDDVIGADIVVAAGGQVQLVDLLPGHSTTAMANKAGHASSPAAKQSAQ